MAERPVRFGKACSSKARAPATTGAENEVPEARKQVVPSQPVMMFSPGATTNFEAVLPARLEKLEMVFDWSVEPTARIEPT